MGSRTSWVLVWVKLYLQKSVCSTQTVMFRDSYLPFLISWLWLNICLASHKVVFIWNTFLDLSPRFTPYYITLNFPCFHMLPASQIPPCAQCLGVMFRNLYHHQGSGCPNQRQGWFYTEDERTRYHIWKTTVVSIVYEKYFKKHLVCNKCSISVSCRCSYLIPFHQATVHYNHWLPLYNLL